MPGSIHRVQKVVFDLACTDQTTAFEARRRLSQAFSDLLERVLEEAFDSHSPNGTPHRIRSVEVDLGVLDLDRLDDRGLYELLLNRLRRTLLDLAPSGRSPAPEQFSTVDTLDYFLRTGRFRWDSQAQTVVELQRAALDLDEIESRRLRMKLVELFRNREVRIRFGHQFDLAFFLWIVGLLDDDAPAVLESAARRLSIDLTRPAFRSLAIEAIVSVVSPFGETKPEDIETVLEKTLTELEEERPFAEEESEALPHLEDEDVLYTETAGIVLLHPFLPRFFDKLGLLDGQSSFSSRSTRSRAIHLLHFLATGRQSPEEHEMILEKVLCGKLITYPVEKELELKEEEKAESEALLASVISHWGRLKNTSPDGLRQGFLCRAGRLVLENDCWQLTVEQRGIDVLLDSLPWSLYRVDLPWLPASVRVDWA